MSQKGDWCKVKYRFEKIHSAIEASLKSQVDTFMKKLTYLGVEPKNIKKMILEKFPSISLEKQTKNYVDFLIEKVKI